MGPIVQEDVTGVLEAASEQQLAAALEVMYLMAKADGFVAADELRQFLGLAKGLSKIDSTRLSALIGTWRKRPAVDVSSRVTELSVVLGSDELRRAAYELASKMATADGQLQDQEMAVLDAIGEALGVV